MQKPLEGIKVVELGIVLAAPYCGLLLSDLGADVIKVESPDGDETRRYLPFVEGSDFSAFTAAINRSKRSISLDLKNPEAVNAYLRICEDADVVLENFRPGVSDRLGVGPEAVEAINPDVIYCAISGFGHKGPRAGDPAMDFFIQAFSGQMSMIGHEDGPVARIGGPMMDITASLHGALGIVSALFKHNRTGKGSLVQTSLLEGQIASLSYMWPAMQATGKPPGKMGRGHPNFCPYQTFEAKDADVAIACLNDRMFRNLAVTIGQPELADDPNFATNAKRVENRPETEAIVEAYVSSRTAQEVADAMRANGVPATPVNTLDKVKADPQVEALGGMLTVDQPGVGEIELAHQALWFDGERAEAEGPAPKLGEHGVEVLAEAGFDSAEIDALKSAGALIES
ncbi:MAG: CaiB/BaiF CoA-transferase family protein [Pseudomonadota bacterium]|nr:CaiB/BaiF CoA-transferase family protein [Pseudomonadota bacterium]MEC8203208.1 CaiB/BaiF CoA-transferase family protein [Pseudomonadota bacterium]MEC8698014.1 CaiB/BaiF CoA-transferase family protein [Pseudomonadota bacterium]MEC8774354.1 CaiB/BaiF CoA-transferase family protein [Pseudomonadota bacterium]|tara:strand:+ start:2041 stop:3237 length:1197 start_codon:yes stop_codon:yes gene_type:complete